MPASSVATCSAVRGLVMSRPETSAPMPGVRGVIVTVIVLFPLSTPGQVDPPVLQQSLFPKRDSRLSTCGAGRSRFAVPCFGCVIHVFPPAASDDHASHIFVFSA